jgi:hypothetical protein
MTAVITAPQPNAAATPPAKISRSQFRRARGARTLLRSCTATLTSNAPATATTAMPKVPVRMLVPSRGAVPNSTPNATSSHTSLLRKNGPSALNASRRSPSVRATNGATMATP